MLIENQFNLKLKCFSSYKRISLLLRQADLKFLIDMTTNWNNRLPMESNEIEQIVLIVLR